MNQKGDVVEAVAKKKDAQTTIRWPRELHVALKVLAAQEGTSIKHLIEVAVRQFVAERSAP